MLCYLNVIRDGHIYTHTQFNTGTHTDSLNKIVLQPLRSSTNNANTEEANLPLEICKYIQTD